MSQNHRLIQSEGTYFFTLSLEDEGSSQLVDHIDRLRIAYAFTTHEMPVDCHAMVVLPNHLHAVWTERGTPKFAERWRRIKARFSRALERENTPHFAPRHNIWRARFNEHPIRSAEDFAKAVEYCRLNPVKHGLVSQPEDWPYSSFVKRAA